MTPGPVYLAKKKMLVQWKSGEVHRFSRKDEQLLPEEFPIVIAFNGIHHFTSTKLVSPEGVQYKRHEILQELLENITELFESFEVSNCPTIAQNLKYINDLGKETGEMFVKWVDGEPIPDSKVLSTLSAGAVPAPSSSEATQTSTQATGLSSATKYLCRDCFKSFSRSDHLQWHSRVVHGEGLYKCGFCDIGFKSTAALKIHITRFHTPKESEYLSQPQGAEGVEPTPGTSGLKATIYWCPYCPPTDPRNYPSKDRLAAHIKKDHKDQATPEELETTPCPRCNKPQRSKELLQKHLKICVGPEQTKTKDVKCALDSCPKKFFDTKGMEKHYKIFHTEFGKKWKCATCGKQLSSQAAINNHVEWMHKDQEEPEGAGQDQ